MASGRYDCSVYVVYVLSCGGHADQANVKCVRRSEPITVDGVALVDVDASDSRAAAPTRKCRSARTLGLCVTLVAVASAVTIAVALAGPRPSGVRIPDVSHPVSFAFAAPPSHVTTAAGVPAPCSVVLGQLRGVQQNWRPHKTAGDGQVLPHACPFHIPCYLAWARHRYDGRCKRCTSHDCYCRRRPRCGPNPQCC